MRRAAYRMIQSDTKNNPWKMNALEAMPIFDTKALRIFFVEPLLPHAMSDLDFVDFKIDSRIQPAVRKAFTRIKHE